jgi:hypothetical protein
MEINMTTTKTHYYKPNPKQLMEVVRWLIARRKVLEQWDAFAAEVGVTSDDLITNEGIVLDLQYYPDTVPFDVADRLEALPIMPDFATLGKALGVAQAHGVRTMGGVLVHVLSGEELPAATPLSVGTLAKRFGIRICGGQCEACGLDMFADEETCGRCGHKKGE